MVGILLFTGKFTNSQMIKDSGVLVKQRKKSKADTTSEKSFTNVFDKGFRNSLDAQLEGQTCIQPKYSKGDMQFEGNDTLHSSDIAVVWSGNESSVDRTNMSWFLKCGCDYHHWCTYLICDVWEVWMFQVNFMYNKFL